MMDFTWFILGGLVAMTAIGLAEARKRFALNFMSLSCLLTGTGLVFLAAAWAVGSVLEGEPRAASIGLLVMGLPGLVLLTFAIRRASKQTLEATCPKSTTYKRTSSKKSLDIPVYNKPRTFSALLRWGAYASLAAAFVAGFILNESDYETLVRNRIQANRIVKIQSDPDIFKLENDGDTAERFIVVEEGQGYGGPMIVGVIISSDGKIETAELLEHTETPAFLKKVADQGFPKQFRDKAVTNNLVIGDDIDAVSGATISCLGATEAVRKASHLMATKYLKLPESWRSEPLKLGLGEVLILGLFILAFVPAIHRHKMPRLVYQMASLTIVGFYMNASISIGNLGGLLMGFIPTFNTHITWWVLTIGSVTAMLIFGKNAYCGRICAFSAVQSFLSKISGSKLQLSPTLLKRSRTVANVLLWFSLMTIFITRNPALGAYEPFAMMFSLDGVGVQWYLLPASLIGSFFLSSYWCRFFCPVGHAFTHLGKIRKDVMAFFKKHSRTVESGKNAHPSNPTAPPEQAKLEADAQLPPLSSLPIGATKKDHQEPCHGE